MATNLRKTGINVIGQIPWGAHFCLFYETKEDLLDTYENQLDESITDQLMTVLCTYPLTSSGAAEILDVARNHQFAVARRGGTWAMIETPELKQAKAEIKRLNEQLERRGIGQTRGRKITQARHNQQAEFAL